MVSCGRNVTIRESSPLNLTEDQLLYEELLIEAISIYGVSAFFLPRMSQGTPDTLYGEDPVSFYNLAYSVPIYLQTFLGPLGPSEMFDKAGLTIADTHKYLIARRTFQQSVPSSVRTRPLEGDLIYIPNFTDLVEIKFVEQEKFFYPLSRKAPLFYCYELQVENYRFSHEQFRTGYQEIDTIGSNYNYTITMNLYSTGNSNLNFTIGEYVFQANSDFNAIVKAWNPSTQVLEVFDPIGFLANSNTILGNTSNALYTIQSFDYKNFSGVKEEIADNLEIETEAEAVLDLDSNNPFGIP